MRSKSKPFYSAIASVVKYSGKNDCPIKQPQNKSSILGGERQAKGIDSISRVMMNISASYLFRIFVNVIAM
jgi:ribosome modulation factor